MPGGPNKSTPFQGLSRPVNSCGYLEGMTTASFRRRLALSAAATSLHRTSGFEVHMSRCNDPASSRNSLFRAKIRDITNTKHEHKRAAPVPAKIRQRLQQTLLKKFIGIIGNLFCRCPSSAAFERLANQPESLAAPLPPACT